MLRDTFARWVGGRPGGSPVADAVPAVGETAADAVRAVGETAADAPAPARPTTSAPVGFHPVAAERMPVEPRRPAEALRPPRLPRQRVVGLDDLMDEGAALLDARRNGNWGPAQR